MKILMRIVMRSGKCSFIIFLRNGESNDSLRSFILLYPFETLGK